MPFRSHPASSNADTTVRGHLVFHDEIRSLLPAWVPGKTPFVLEKIPDRCPSDSGHVALISFEAADASERNHILCRADRNRHKSHVDLLQTMDFIRLEGYRPIYRPLYSFLPFSLQFVPPQIRHRVFGLLNLVGGMRARRTDGLFPEWPKDVSVDALSCAARMAGLETHSAPAWPRGKKYAVILTHDVDSDWAFRHEDRIREVTRLEKKAGMRSAWYIVVQTIGPHRRVLDRWKREGHEIGFHCYNHDHRFPFLPPRQMARRIEDCLPFLETYQVKGMRAAHYLKTRAFQSLMGRHLDYDLSYRDVYHGVGGSHGCSTVLPFRLRHTNMVEIPTTVPEDYVLFSKGLDRENAYRIQAQAVENIKSRGGVVNIVTHTEPHLSMHSDGLYLYERLLETVASDRDAWLTRPCELASWWSKHSPQD